MFERFFALFGPKADASLDHASASMAATIPDQPSGLLSGSFRPAHPQDDATENRPRREDAFLETPVADTPRREIAPARSAEDWAKLSDAEFGPAQSKYLTEVLTRVIDHSSKDESPLEDRLHLAALRQAAGASTGPDFIPYARLDLTKKLATQVSIPNEEDRAGLSVALRETARRHFDSMARFETALSGSQVRLHEVIHISEGKQVMRALGDNEKHGLQKRPEGIRDIDAIADMARSASSEPSRAALFSQVAAAQGKNGYLVIASAMTADNPKPIAFKPVIGEDGNPGRSTTGLFYVNTASEIVTSAAAWRRSIDQSKVESKGAER
jgi:hypothetical protein